MVQNPNFDIPPEMRSMAEQSVEQAKKAFDGFMTAVQVSVDHLQSHASAAHAGIKDMQAKALGFAESNVKSSFDYAGKLAQAKSPEELLRIQTEYVQSQIAVLNEQAKQLGQAAAKSGTRAADG